MCMFYFFVHDSDRLWCEVYMYNALKTTILCSSYISDMLQLGVVNLKGDLFVLLSFYYKQSMFRTASRKKCSSYAERPHRSPSGSP